MVTLRQKIIKQQMEAYNSNNEKKQLIMNFIVAAIVDCEHKNQEDRLLNDDEIIKILLEMSTQKEKFLSRQNNSQDKEKIQKEQYELSEIKSFLPKQLSEDEIKILVKETIKKMGIDSIRDIDMVINILKKEYNDQINFSPILYAVKQELLADHY